MQIKKLISKIVLNPLSKRAEFISLGLCLVIASSIFTSATWGGLIWTSDSFHYWAASRSFIAEGIFLSHDGGSYVYWPPLFPFILSFFSSEATYYYAHFLIFNTALYFIYLFLKKISASQKKALLSLFIFIISPFPYLMTSFLWTETIFTFLLYAGLHFYNKWNETNNFKWGSLWIILFASMCLQRNAGIFIMIGISIYALTDFIQNKNLRKLLFNTVGVFLTVIPNIIWNLSILRMSSGPSAEIEINLFNGIFSNINNVSLRLLNFILPTQTLGIIDFVALITIIMVFALLILKKSNYLLTFIFLTYLAMLSFMPLIEVDSIDRFIAPVLPIFIFLLISIIPFPSTEAKSTIKLFVFLLLFSFLFYNTIRTYKNVKMWHERSITNPKAAKIFF